MHFAFHNLPRFGHYVGPDQAKKCLYGLDDNVTRSSTNASMAIMSEIPSKRRTEGDGSASAKQRRHYHHTHRPKVRQEIDQQPAAVISDETVISRQLERAIQVVLQAVGYSHAEPAALESLRGSVEEYMEHFLEQVRVSMVAARRVQPIPQDFLFALEQNQLQLRSLLAHLDPPVPATRSQPPLSVENLSQDASIHEAQLINHLFSQTSLDTDSHVPKNFPKLPSQHTFKSESVFPTVVDDAKQIREQATEESRLGEEALRRLMSKKASGDNTLLTGLRSGSKLSLRQKSRALWRETYEEALRNASVEASKEGGVSKPDAMDIDQAAEEGLSHLGPAVNADSIYFRTPIARKITETVPVDG